MLVLVRCLCSTSWPTLPPVTSCVVCCVVHMPMPKCVRVGRGGGAHMTTHASSVLVFISLCVLPLHPTPTLVSLRCDACMNVFVLVVF